MILTRMRQRFRDQDWFGVGLELIIVVLGVFLGIQASNWNTARIEQDTGRAYRERLVDDFRANVTDMDVRIAYFRQVRAHAYSALEALDKPASDLGEPFIGDVYEATQITPRPIKRNTWDEILSSGSLNLIGDPEVRTELSNFYLGADIVSFTLQTITPYRAHVREVMPYAVQAQVRERCPEQISVDSNNTVRAHLARTCTVLGLSPEARARTVALLRADPELRPDLNFLLNDLDQKIMLAGAFRGTAAAMLERWTADKPRSPSTRSGKG